MQEANGRIKVLGIGWNYETDILDFDVTTAGKEKQSSVPTKRGILSTFAMLFDPLGLTSHVGVQAKIIFQELCLEKLGWDEPIFENKVRRWEEWLRDLNEVKTIQVSRCVQDENEGSILSCKVDGFGDAS